ncbi:MAG: Gfo/Idh/MocA family oxidoreductase, partial [Planctomycetes bacterium]|nr:Gfo/Idh/MocA family oxidoreductase [Planctomycetota bacterium]
MTNDSDRTIRWGILGTARIATKVSEAIVNAANAELTAIASRDLARAEKWRSEHGALRSYGSYRELIDDPDIDVVYIPLPPSLHAEWTIAAAEWGKHVLCEKPAALNSQEVVEMTAACREHNVQFMDGVMWVHHPRAEEMRQTLRKGNLGRLRRFTSAFSFHWETIPEGDLRLSRDLGGGALLDLGWYCIRATLWAFQQMPQRVYGTSQWYGDVDMTT